MKIQANQPPALPPLARLARPSGLEQKIVDRLLPGPDPVPVFLRAAARSTVTTGACGATLGAALGSAAALAQQASPLTGGVLGAVLGAGLGHALARYGQIRQQRASESDKTVDFARQLVRQSDLADGQVQEFGSALVVSRGTDLLVHFKNSGDFLLARGLGDKNPLYYVSEPQARPGTPMADFLTSHNGKIPSSSYQLYGPAGQQLQSDAGQNLRMDLADDGKLSIRRDHPAGSSTTVYDLANSAIHHPSVTIENGVVTQLNGHDPGLSLPAYDGHGEFWLGRTHSLKLPLEPEVFGPVRARSSLAETGSSRQAAADMAKAGLESCASQDLESRQHLDIIAPVHVDEIYKQTKDQDVRALIEFARETSKAHRRPGQIMGGVLKTLASLTEQTSRLELFKQCGRAVGGDHIAADFLTKVKTLSDSSRDQKLIGAVLNAPNGVADNLDRNRAGMAREAVYAVTWEILDNPDLSLTQSLSQAGLAMADSTFQSGLPPRPADLQPTTDYFLKTIQAEAPGDSPQNRLVQLTTTCGGNPFRGGEIQGLAGYGALQALASPPARQAELLARAGLAARDTNRFYGNWGRTTSADWAPYLQPLRQGIQEDLADKPALQNRVNQDITSSPEDILQAVLAGCQAGNPLEK